MDEITIADLLSALNVLNVNEMGSEERRRQGLKAIREVLVALANNQAELMVDLWMSK